MIEMQQINGITWFDCNCSIGFSKLPEDQPACNVSGLKEHMACCGISEALVWNIACRNYDPMTGNQELNGMLDGFMDIHPMWVIIPGHAGDFFKPEVLPDEMKKHGVKAVRVFPFAECHNFSLKPWTMDKIYRVLEEYQIPLFIGLEQTSWEEIHEIAAGYGKLKIIVTGVGYRNGRMVYPLMEACRNVYIETSMFKVPCELDRLVGRFGPERFLFGTGYPKYSMGSAIALVSYCSMSNEEKGLIASGNLIELLGGCII